MMQITTVLLAEITGKNRVEGMGVDRWETCNNIPTEKKVGSWKQWKVDHELGAGTKL